MRQLIYILICTIATVTAVQAESPFTTLTSGDYVLSQSIDTVNKDTGKPEKLVIIETLRVDRKRSKELLITPMDNKSKYFAKAKGFITDSGHVQFGFTLVRNKVIFSVNYDGELTDDGYIKGSVIGIYPGAEAAVKGEWAMKLIAKPKKPMILK